MAKIFRRLALLVLFGLGALLAWRRGSPLQPKPSAVEARSQTANEATPAPTPPLLAANAAANTAESAAGSRILARKLFEFSRRQSSLEQLVMYLKSTSQEPEIARDHNSATGEMTIVRSLHPLPGTRYLHVQYFANEDGSQRFLQHLSFEVPPGPQALEEASRALEAAIPGLGQPIVRNDVLVEWDLGDGYVVWAKKLGARDLSDNPWNAYTSADLGSVRVAIELKPEED